MLELRTVPRLVIFTAALFVSIHGCSSRDVGENAVRDKSIFRDRSIDFVREFVRSREKPLVVEKPAEIEIEIERPCTVVTVFFLDGERQASGRALGNEYSEVLEQAVLSLYEEGGLTSLGSEDIERGRFYIAVMFDNGERISFVEHHGRGLELAAKVTALRYFDRKIMAEMIAEGKEYLIRMLDPEMHGIFKRYDAVLGEHDGRLRTIFTSSTLFTLMKMNDMESDARIEGIIPEISEFILSMQKQSDPHIGAFYYSYFQETGEKEQHLVIGTASKTIFTLLELYRRTADEIYMEAAKNAGEWLLTMIRDDGVMINSVTLIDGEWVEEIRFSYLYAGQFLSAMSRLYTATGDERYLKAAGRIAERFIDSAAREEYFVSDGWRSNYDPVPISWVMMSLLDHYKVTRDTRAKETILRSAEELISRQYSDIDDIRNFGRYHATATSGSGWIAEVMAEIYVYGKNEGWEGIEKYKDSILKAARWLTQNTYREENTFFIKNSETVYGGPIHQYNDDAVRTDAVCHAVNGYLAILPYLSEDDVVDVPEKRQINRGCAHCQRAS